jgi:hypothetical protein
MSRELSKENKTSHMNLMKKEQKSQPRKWLAFQCFWQGCEDSNLGMTESESVAVPLGDTPKK